MPNLKICRTCLKEYSVPPRRDKTTRYCSIECRAKDFKGRSIPKEVSLKIMKSWRKKVANGYKHPLRGKPLSEEWVENIRKSKLGELNPKWKSGAITYEALHQWVSSRIKKDSCENCGSTKNIDMANISGLYKRDLTDWVSLCRRCHMISDGRMERFLATRKPFTKTK
jgi:hypothetical protein